MMSFVFPQKLAIGADHAGFQLKQEILPFLQELGFEVKDFGAYSEDRMDYPDVAHPLAIAIENGDFPCGILICGSGQGVSITANKHQGIRSALVWNLEITALSRGHNNANVLALPARFMDIDTAKACILTFLTTPFEGGRHADRVEKIGCI
jgi:ribose 5-phosphate isomerase B